MAKFYNIEKNGDKTPMVETRFYNWLKSQSIDSATDFSAILNSYLDVIGFNPKYDKLSPKSVCFATTVFAYYCTINKIALDKRKTYYIVKNGDALNVSSFRFSDFGVEVDYSGALYNEWGDYNLDLGLFISLHNRKIRTNRVLHDGDSYFYGLIKPEIYFLSVCNQEQVSNAQLKQNRAQYLKPASAISIDHYHEMLDVLPPENWTHGSFEHFRMSEYQTGPITKQFAKLGDKCISKYIDVTDKATWITLDDFNAI